MEYKRGRIFIVLTLIAAVWGGLLGRAVFIQVLPNSKLASLKEKQFNKMITLQPRRGVILDRNGKELAASITTHSIFADPALIQNKIETAKKLSKILGVRAIELRSALKQKEKRFIWLKRNVSEAEKQKVEELHIRGISSINESKRVYPNNSLLAPVIGFVGGEGQGLQGLESKFNDQLGGVQKKMQVQRDARGRPLVVDGRLFTERPDGATFTLTVDSEIQYVLETELKKAIEEFNAQGAVGVILDAKTSEVLGMASLPDFDPNRPSDSPIEHRRNKVLTDPFEPGSTLKTFIVAAGLREKVLSPNTKYFCENGMMKIGKRTIKEADRKHKFGWLTASEILAKSSNVGSAKIGFQLGEEKIYRALNDFGFMDRTGIALGGESRGLVPSLPWKDITLATVSFGHGIATTPIQMAAAYAAIANGGEYKVPTIVKSVQDPETGDTTDFPKPKPRRVLTRDQARTMMFMLTSVTQADGTAPVARINGFPVAGKTGTAQKIDNVNGGYLPNQYISSFAGIIPAQDPQYVIYVAIDQPQKHYYGSEVAAPVFQKVGSYLIRKSGMEPVLLTEKNVIESVRPKVAKKAAPRKIYLENEMYQVPDLKGLTVKDVIERVHGAPVEVRIMGTGTVSEQVPAVGSLVLQGETVKVYLKQ